MITRTLLTGLLAGTAASAVLTVLTVAKLQPLILAAEVFEHGGGAVEALSAGRVAETALFNLLTGVAFGLLLAAAMVLRGRQAGIRGGLLWGAAGFAVFTLAPGVGLPPELPGSAAAPLEERQLWWVLTVMATGAGIGLAAFAARTGLKIAGLMIILVPHLVGAPHPAEIGGTLPAELAAQFVATSFGAMALFWLALGAVAGYCHDRFSLGQGARLSPA